jgi:hypothetical protein
MKGEPIVLIARGVSAAVAGCEVALALSGENDRARAIAVRA